MQRSNDLVHDRDDGVHRLNLPYGDGHVDVEPCSDDGFLPAWGTTEWTADLPSDSLSDADIEID